MTTQKLIFTANTVQGRVREAYDQRGMTRAEFARRLGVGYAVVCNWENERYMPTIVKLRDICRVLDVSTDDLIWSPDEDRPGS